MSGGDRIDVGNIWEADLKRNLFCVRLEQSSQATSGNRRQGIRMPVSREM